MQFGTRKSCNVSELWHLRQESEVAPIIADYWERAEFPHQIVPGLAKLNIASSTVQGYGAPGLSVMGAAMAAVETARVDGSISTFVLVHGSLCCLTIGRCPCRLPTSKASCTVYASVRNF